MSVQADEIKLTVVRPSPGEDLTIRQGTTFVIGTVTPPQARVWINGAAAEVSDDGAFLAMAPIQLLAEPQTLPLSAGRAKRVDARFECVAETSARQVRRVILVATPAVSGKTEPPVELFPAPRRLRMRHEQILSQTATPDWGLLYLPRGAQVMATARQGNRFRLAVGEAQETWVEATDFEDGGDYQPAGMPRPRTLNAHEARIQLDAVVPFTIVQLLDPARLRLILHLPEAQQSYEIPAPSPRAGGFSARYEGTTLVVRQRGAPDPDGGLRNKTICLDPGHHPDPGAVGPRGLEEREVNLQIALVLERMLQGAGARVVFTRRAEPLPLRERRAVVQRLNPDIFISLHNNSVPDGTDPRTNHGTMTLYYHPQSRALAQAVHEGMRRRLGLPDLGVQRKSLFVCRITECPAILVEPTFIILPDQERLLLSADGREKIAAGIVDGIRQFFGP